MLLRAYHAYFAFRWIFNSHDRRADARKDFATLRKIWLINRDTLRVFSHDYTAGVIARFQIFVQEAFADRRANVNENRPHYAYVGVAEEVEIACSLSDYVNGLRTRPQFDSREPTRSKHLRPGMFNGFPRHAKMPRCSESATKSSLITPRNLSTVSSSRRDCNSGKMIASIVLALFLFCQSINIGGCLLASETRANRTSEQISQRRMKRSLTFPDPSMLLVRNRLIASLFKLLLILVVVNYKVVQIQSFFLHSVKNIW